MRVLAVDLGSRRIGVAVSDPGGILASPYTTVERSAAVADDHRRLALLVDETGAERVIVGLPLSLDGSHGPAARGVEAEVEALRDVLPVPVELLDERFTTVSAHQSLAAGGKRAKQRRDIVDQTAAAILLQTWLDAR